MGVRTGNPTWVDYPATTTLITAARLNAIESAVDTSVVVAGDLGGTAAAPVVAKVNGVAVTGTPTAGQVPVATSGTAATWQTPNAFVALARSANQSIPTATVTEILWTVETEDASGFHDLVTNTGRVTVPAGQAGLYFVCLNIAYAANATGGRSAILLKNGSTVTDIGNLSNQKVGDPSYVGISQTVRLAAGDYLQFQAYQDSGGALDLMSTRSTVTVTRLGA